MYDTVVSGCSFTDPNFKSGHEDAQHLDFSFLKWPDHLSSYTGWNIKNLARSGICNGDICNDLFDFITSDEGRDVKRCIIAATEWTRFSLFAMNFYWQYLMGEEVTPDPWPKEWKDKWWEHPIVRFSTVHLKNILLEAGIENKYEWACRYTTKQNLRSLAQLEVLCSYRDIELYYFQMLPIEGGLWITKNDVWKLGDQVRTEHPIFNKIKKDHYFLTTPNSKAGYLDFWDLIKEFGDTEQLTNRDLRVSDNDHHPGALGHKMIADWVYKRICERS